MTGHDRRYRVLWLVQRFLRIELEPEDPSALSRESASAPVPDPGAR
jgi:hypothetical protein